MPCEVVTYGAQEYSKGYAVSATALLSLWHCPAARHDEFPAPAAAARAAAAMQAKDLHSAYEKKMKLLREELEGRRKLEVRISLRASARQRGSIGRHRCTRSRNARTSTSRS